MGIFSFISEFSGFSNNAVAIDLGTVNTLIAIHGAGVVLREATAVAVAGENQDIVLAVGNEAVEMSGRTPTGLVLRYPFREGVIADYRLAEYMIHDFFKRAIHTAHGHSFYTSPRVLLCVPDCVTDVERRAVCEAVRRAGARDVLVAEEIMAACVGSGLPYDEPTGSMVVDIGGGTVDTAVIALGGIVVSKSMRSGGNNIDRAIIGFVRRKYNIIIGNRSAEQIKCSLSDDDKKQKNIEVCGLNPENGLPKKISVPKTEIEESIRPSIDEIVTLVHDVLSKTPPELAGDIIKNGITLCGGGAYLYGLATAITISTGIETVISPKPFECVALGALEMLNNMRHGKTATMPGMVEQEA
ncbi:MAG: rod shape-determining protein [Clostridia bacterium]|nr:rod shape-determining protein [Clostridia bacterium]